MAQPAGSFILGHLVFAMSKAISKLDLTQLLVAPTSAFTSRYDQLLDWAQGSIKAPGAAWPPQIDNEKSTYIDLLVYLSQISAIIATQEQLGAVA
jgi:hypothetical protein